MVLLHFSSKVDEIDDSVKNRGVGEGGKEDEG